MSVKRITILGGGMMGSAMARDIATDPDFEVTVYEFDAARVAALDAIHGVTAREADLSSQEGVSAAVEGADVVLGALPSRMGLDGMRRVINAGKNYVDLAFMEEDPRQLDQLAKSKGVTVIYDCGVAPGISNVLCGSAMARMGRVDKIEIYVGGLPRIRTWPYQYKAPFDPFDVIEEYTRPSRIVENGKIVVRPALSEPELMDFPEVGTLEAFNTDGLRSLIDLPVPNMIEKTLRYPGHIEIMRVLRETGFFNKDIIRLDSGVEVSPLEVTTKLLFPMWTFEDGEADLTVFRTIIHGTLDDEHVRLTYDLFDERDPETGLTSMSRTTGYPCCLVGRMVARGEVVRHGVAPPEALAEDPGFWPRLREGLAARGVVVLEDVVVL